MNSVQAPSQRARTWSRQRLLRTAVLALAIGSPACGHLGIDLDDGGDGGDGFAGAPPDGSGGSDTTVPASGGASSGGTTGGDSAGGDSSGGQSQSGGDTSSGGTNGDGGSGGDAAGGTAGAGGSSGGAGGTSSSCNVGDTVCEALGAVLLHRYSFDGTGTDVIDAVGGQDGTAMGTSLDGSGELDFSGMADSVTLPAGLISSLPNASIEVWFEWDGGEQWQWIFAFGHQMGPASPTSYLYATPEAGGTMLDQNALAAGIRHVDVVNRELRTTLVTATGIMTHLVLVANDTDNRLSLFKNGQWVANRDTDVHLIGIDDDTNRLGRSLVVGDPAFDGRITEFRIYGDILSDEMVAKSYELGPDTTFAP